MTGEELHQARVELGKLWGHPVGPNELARALRFGKSGADRILTMERGFRPVSGPVSVCMEAFLAGYRPPHTIDPD